MLEQLLEKELTEKTYIITGGAITSNVIGICDRHLKLEERLSNGNGNLKQMLHGIIVICYDKKKIK